MEKIMVSLYNQYKVRTECITKAINCTSFGSVFLFCTLMKSSYSLTEFATKLCTYIDIDN